MKHIFYLSILMIFALATTSCAEEEEVYTGSIQGIVTESGTTNPLSGVQVSIVNTGTSTTTGSDGQFMFTDIEAKSYRLQFSKDGYETNTRSVTVVAGGTANCDTQLDPVAQDAEISISPSTLNFGTTQDQLSVTLRNNGNAETEWSIDLAGNNWLQASPASGNIAAGRSQSIVFTVDRSLLSEPKSARVNLSAFGNSYTISISCAPRNAQSEMSVTPTSINFGGTLSEQAMTISNTGSALLSWSISGITEGCISVSETGGTVEAGGSKVVKVLLDRSMLTTDLNTSFVISDMIREQIINVTASIDGSDDPGSDPDDPSGTVVTSGLYTYYKFDGDFTDSYNSVDGYGNNSPQFVEGVDGVGQAVKFNRTDNSSFIVNSPIIDSRKMTISFWVKGLSDGHIFHLVSSNGSTGTNSMLTLSMNGGSLKFIVRRYNNNYQYSNRDPFTHPALDDGNWHHIALVSDFNSTSYATTTTMLYVDGLSVSTVTESVNPFDEDGGSMSSYDTGTMFVMGGSLKLNNTNLNGSNMTIDNFRVYDTRLLSAQEIKQIYEAKQ